MSTEDVHSYAAAGVDIPAYEALLARVKPLIEATHGPSVAKGVGPFAGLYELPTGGWLAASADGVGTKVKVAVAAGEHRGIGQDLVNHCINDIATAGARPLFMLDYFSTGKLDATVFEQVVEGLTTACLKGGCALLGGETAEMPGLYALGDYDLAGFIVGIVESGGLPEISSVRPGDLLVGLPSAGLHTNGFSLVRRVFQDVGLDEVFPELGQPLGEVLLTPHLSYLDQLRSLTWKSAAHITGGGIPGNLPRALPEGLKYRIDRARWEEPPIFGLIRTRGRITEDEMLATFNLGIGMILVVAPDAVPAGFPVIGEVVS